MENIFHSYTLDNLLLQPFPLLLPPYLPSPPLSFPSFPFFLPSEAFRSSFRTKKRSLGQRQPLLQQALTLAPLDTLARPLASLVRRPPGDGRRRGMVVPRPLSVEQIAATSPKERRDQRPPSRLQIASCDSREKSPRKGQFCPPHSATDSRIPGRLGSRLPILPSG